MSSPDSPRADWPTPGEPIDRWAVPASWAETILEEAPFGAYLVALDQAGVLRLVHANTTASAIRGMDHASVVGRPIEDAFPGLAGDPLVEAIGRTARLGERVDVEGAKYVDARGEGIYDIHAFQVAQGAAAIFFRDVRGKVDSRRAIVELEASLRESQTMDALGRLASGVAAEFNNLLTGILGYVELLIGDLEPDHPALGPAEEILNHGRRAAGLTAQLLAFGRAQAMEPVVVDLGEAVAQVMPMLSQTLGSGVRIEFHRLPAPLPILVDPAHLEQAISRLIISARDAMSEGGRVSVTTTRVDDGQAVPVARLIMSDSRPMADASDLGHAFEPFRTDASADAAAGLGLAAVYGTITQLGGTIRATGDEIGATFTVEFPIAEDVPATTLVVPETPVMGGERILVVDDDLAVRTFIERALTASGYQVISTDDPLEALRIVQEYREPINLMLTDVVMRGMRGPELAQQAALARPAMRVLFTSGYTDGLYDQWLPSANADLLAKPFSIDDLMRQVRRVLDR